MSGFLSKPKRKLWSDESMAAAVRSVREGMGLRESARLYNVPIETLRRRVIGSVDLDCKSGPPTVLTKDEEDMLARYLVEMADMGFGLSPEDVRYTAFRIAEASGRPHPFQSGIAGYAWMDGFRVRHPRLAVHTAQSLSRSRAACANEDTISDYFAKSTLLLPFAQCLMLHPLLLQIPLPAHQTSLPKKRNNIAGNTRKGTTSLTPLTWRG